MRVCNVNRESQMYSYKMCIKGWVPYDFQSCYWTFGTFAEFCAVSSELYILAFRTGLVAQLYGFRG